MVSTTSPDFLQQVIIPPEWQSAGNSRADWDLHLVVLGLDVKTLLLESLDDLVPDVESLHTLPNVKRGLQISS